ncbi:RNA-directed DNA polymerase, eukaryota, reverse transcriptase zinc-binding domain protein [Tanacetum coccineum]
MSNPSTFQPFRWNKFLPAKVNILVWRIMNKRVPTRVNLDKRGIDLDYVRCPLCDDDIETEDHLFALCSIAKDVWKEVMAWWKVSGVLVTSVDDAALLSDGVPILPKLKKPFDVAVNTTLWHLWNFRNNAIFSSKYSRKELLLNDIKLSSFNCILLVFNQIAVKKNDAPVLDEIDDLETGEKREGDSVLEKRRHKKLALRAKFDAQYPSKFYFFSYLQPTNEVLERAFADPTSSEFSAKNVIPRLIS